MSVWTSVLRNVVQMSVPECGKQHGKLSCVFGLLPIAFGRFLGVLSEWCGVHRGFPLLHYTMSVTQPTGVALTNFVLNQGAAARARVWPRGILCGPIPGSEYHIYPLPFCV